MPYASLLDLITHRVSYDSVARLAFVAWMELIIHVSRIAIVASACMYVITSFAVFSILT